MTRVRKRDRTCIVCGAPCTGRTCNACHHTKNNKISGRYNKNNTLFKRDTIHYNLLRESVYNNNGSHIVTE